MLCPRLTLTQPNPKASRNDAQVLEISLNAPVLASLSDIPTKQNIIIQRGTHAFHELLETLQRALFAGCSLALEHLLRLHILHGITRGASPKAFRYGWFEMLGNQLVIGCLSPPCFADQRKECHQNTVCVNV